MLASCRHCKRELDFEAKSETISYYCSLPCYHGGQSIVRGAVIMPVDLANAIHALQLAWAKREGTARGCAFARAERIESLRPSGQVASHAREPAEDWAVRLGFMLFLETDTRGDYVDARTALAAVALATEVP